MKRRIVEIRPKFEDDACNFHPSKKGVPISEVAKIVDEAFRIRYTFSSVDSRTGEYSGYDLDGTLWEFTEAEDDGVIRALADELLELEGYWPPDGGEPFYSDEVGYEVNDFGYEEHSNTWQFFRREILHEQRFFNTKASGPSRWFSKQRRGVPKAAIRHLCSILAAQRSAMRTKRPVANGDQMTALAQKKRNNCSDPKISCWSEILGSDRTVDCRKQRKFGGGQFVATVKSIALQAILPLFRICLYCALWSGQPTWCGVISKDLASHRAVVCTAT